MIMLIVGLLLWTVVHLFPSVAPAGRQLLVTRLGNHAYQGLFSLFAIAALVLIVAGWRNTVPGQL